MSGRGQSAPAYRVRSLVPAVNAWLNLLSDPVWVSGLQCGVVACLLLELAGAALWGRE